MDIFATKGLEYILILGYLAALIIFWRYLTGKSVVPVEIARSGRTALAALGRDWFRMPAGYYYHRGHSWAKADSNGLFRVGLDDFAGKLLGRPDSIILPRPGHTIAAGRPGWGLEVGGRVIRQAAPLHGTVTEVNPAVLEDPEAVTDDPYGRGWLMKVRVDSPVTQLRSLMPATLARVWTDSTFSRLTSMMGPELGPVLQDGGVLVPGFVRQLAGEGWPQLAAELLMSDESSA